uniref:ATP-dependent DNA helicase n=1 Tax=Trichogramma kaykai TaxID=54128 RepID=A0ABD2WQD3_9HYME
MECAVTALCGLPMHVSSKEPHFREAAYSNSEEIICEDSRFVIDEIGRVTNILPVISVTKKNRKNWECSGFCKSIDVIIVSELKQLFMELSELNFSTAHRYFRKIDICTAESRNIDKKGHPLICYMDPITCGSKFLYLRVLSFHYPKLRTIERQIYLLRQIYAEIEKIENALIRGDFNTLTKVLSESEKGCIRFNPTKVNEVCLDENVLRDMYQEGIKIYTQKIMDTPVIPCVSCERLCTSKSIKSATDLFVKPSEHQVKFGVENDKIKLLIRHYGKTEFQNESICKTCYEKLRFDEMPPMCVLNNLAIAQQLIQISSLNDFEKMLIQRAKAFQTIYKLNTVMKKKIPHHVKIDKVKGRTFHLPLPLQETLNKICPKTDPLDTNNNLFILVRSCPTKAKTIWEDLVDIKKIWEALVWFKSNNPLYKEILLPSQPQELLSLLNNENLQYEIAEKDNNTDEPDTSKCIDSKEHNENETAMIKINDGILKHGALLTQKVESDSYYEDFTIYPLHGNKINETDSKLYQMLQVYANPIDYRNNELDLKCFPDLYPNGINGQYEFRNTKLRDFDYIKTRLISKDPRFRTNKQFLFYCLHNSNMRQLNGEIFHKLNVTNPKFKYTVGNLIANINNTDFSNDIMSIFARLRGTQAYWRRVRNDINCMMFEYGPVTWFITFSPSEWMWSGLREFIRTANGWEHDNRSISELIAVDPVSASIYIYHTFKAMLDYILSPVNPIGKVSHYYYTCEFQGRGTPHYHWLFWIQDAPVYGSSTNEEVSEFILKYATCRIPDRKTSPDLHRKVMDYQQHKHNSYCMRSKKTATGISKSCRFGFPRSITKTLVLRSVESSIANRRKQRRKNRFYDLPRNEQENYTNDYIPSLLLLWEGNMDAQYVCESSYIVSKYITKYGTKGEKGTAEVDFSDIQTNKSLASRLWSFAFRVLNHRECGALEAACTLLNIPLHETDDKTVIKWLDVRMIRSRRAKFFKDIKKLHPDSRVIFYDSFIDTYYPNRPVKLESICLYDFAKWYDVIAKRPRQKKAEYYPFGAKFCKKRTNPCLINHWKYNPANEPENYFYALLLLFMPWRNTDELKCSKQTYTEAYEEKQSDLLKAMEYYTKFDTIRQATEFLEKLVEDKMMEENDQTQSNHDTLPVGCVAIEIEMAMKDFQDMMENIEIDPEDLKNSISQLNVDQSRVFQKITSTIGASDKTLRCFVSGPGGTGKSFVIDTLIKWNKVERGKHTAVTAPTGIAAYNVKGLTVHRLFQIPVEPNKTAKFKELSDGALKKIRQELTNVDLLIIDEISMVSNILLTYIHLRLTEIFNTSDERDGWFGKINIVVFGDLLQLPPVKEDFSFVQLSKEKIEKYIGGTDTFNLWSLFEYDELTINMRQKGDQQYSEILSHIRLGYASANDINLLNEKKIAFVHQDSSETIEELCSYLENLPTDAVCLLPKNTMCKELNTAMLRRLPLEEIKLIAKDFFQCDKKLEKKINTMLEKEDNSNQCGIERIITIKIGSTIMIRRNIDVSLGLVNGAIAKVLSVSKNIKGEINSVEVCLANSVRKQFPICCSYGITIHKSQGLSLKNAVVEAGNEIFENGQTSVALSRVTSREGLHLINFDPSKIKASGPAIIEYNRLKKEFRPDLPQYNDVPIMSKYRTRDNKWVPQPISIQTDVNKKNIPIVTDVKGLINDDGYSSYVNVTLQCLFHCEAIRRVLSETKEELILKKLFQSYVSGDKLNLRDLKHFVNIKYLLPIIYDVAEFLVELISKQLLLQQILSHELTKTLSCTGCKDIEVVKCESNYIL